MLIQSKNYMHVPIPQLLLFYQKQKPCCSAQYFGSTKKIISNLVNPLNFILISSELKKRTKVT